MQQQKLCLKWNNHTLNLLSVLETFQQKDILVDVTLSCEGHNIKAHKMILSACSPYFQNIFLENPCQHPIVIINGMKYEDITAILNFMYKGEVNVSHDGLSSFLQAAEALKVKGLAEVCGEKKSPGSGSQEPEQNEQTRPQRTETPTTKRRHRNRKRSLSDSNRSDEEAAPRKHKGSNSPEVHELSGDESYTGDMSSNGQNSRVPQNVYSRSHQSSSNITADDMDDEYEVEPSKMLEQTLTTDNANSASSDNSLRIERIMGNATEMESSSLHEPESPPDIKPIIEYGESSAGPSEGSMMVYNEQSQPGPSNMQDGSLLHDNSHTQGKTDFFMKLNNTYSHAATVIDDPPLVCGHCLFIATKKSELASHMYAHRDCRQASIKKLPPRPGRDVYACYECIYSTNSYDQISKHLHSHSNSGSICKRCQRKFISVKTYRKHLCRKYSKPQRNLKHPTILTKNPPAIGAIKKEAVKKEAVKKQAVKKQAVKKEAVKKEAVKKESVKNESVKNESVKKEVVEKEADASIESSSIPPNNLTKSHICIKCKKSFANIQELYSHRRIAHETEIYHCDSCSDVFSEIYRLECHRKYNHKNEQIYTCDVCCKRFTSVVEFSHHKNQHPDIQENTDS